MKKTITLFAILFFLAGSDITAQNIIYVTHSGTGNGSSWATATGNLQAAIDSAATQTPKPDIWVAAGIYYGDSIAENNAFTMADGVDVYGGFAGNEPANYDLNLRNFETNETVLDGQNVQRVLYQAAGFTDTTTWDGFTIQNGVTSGRGGGAYILHNAMLNYCHIINNKAYVGGGIYAVGDEKLIINCVIYNNRASYGGGISAGSTLIVNCSLYNNMAYYSGGAAYMWSGTCVNCLFSNNTAYYGGGIYADGEDNEYINCNIVNNSILSSFGEASGIFSYFQIHLTNCILWGNKKTDNYSTLYSYGEYILSYCAIEGGYSGSTNIDIESNNNGNGLFYARFVNPSSIVGIDTVTQNIDWSLQVGSICINRANNDIVTDTIDLAGNIRIQQGRVDIGCYESPYQAVVLPTYPDGIIYVKEGGSGTMTGTSWNNAMDNLQDALAIASYIDTIQVWVAAGTYSGNGIAENNAFTMMEGVNVYGGFAGNEPANFDLNLRNFETNETVLDGQNVQRVLYQPYDFIDTTTWDGFTIQNGVTNGYGGGAYLRAKSVLSHCNITNNTSSDAGGGVYASSSTLTNCNISNNTSNSPGGGVYAYSNSQFINCNIVNNRSTYYGGGVYNNNSDNSFTNCIIWGNKRGAIANQIYNSGNFTYCAIEGGYTGVGNIFLESENNGNGLFYAKFVNPSSIAGIDTITQNIDWRLQENSICINRGNDRLINTSFDLAGNIRIQQNRVDIGCYESPYQAVVLPTYPDDIIYVKEGGSGTMDGTSWNNAMANLQDVLFIAQLCDLSQVWVAAGTYYGDSIAANNAFTMMEGVNVYGGFAGNEPADYDLALRDFESNETVLDGQRVQRVLYQAAGFTDTTTWDGLTIQNGVTNGYGGGAYLRAKSVLNHCNITNNTIIGSGSCGGGVYAYSSTLTNCNISNNTSNSNGGGVSANSNSQFINCDIVNNRSTYSGGGVYNSNLDNSFTNCIIWGNKQGSTANQIYGSSTFNYCAIEGGYTGEGNILLNAENNGNGFLYVRFVNPSSIAGIDTITQNIDWRLQENSICINRGNDSLINTSFDLGGNTRIQQNRVDIGCYESPYQAVVLPTYPDGIIYVKEGGSGTMTGTSWNNAMAKMQDAIPMASYIDSLQIWVAAGTYYGDSIATNNAFTMADGVDVYGGFAGNEPADYDLSLRDFETNETVLDGQNVQRVLYQTADFTDTTTWNGFKIQNGVTNGSGGGAYVRAKSVLSHCNITNNTSSDAGGGVYAENSTLTNCNITNNTSIYGGGGVYASSSILTNCNISNNTSDSPGGGVYANSNSQFINCNIVNNRSIYYSVGGIYNSNSNNTYTNCIIWGNTINQIYGSSTFNYCAIEGGYTGEGNILLNAENNGNGFLYVRFVNPSSIAGIDTITQNIDWRLQENSICINRGNDSLINTSFDLGGNTRIQQNRVDIGCYESPYQAVVLPTYPDGIIYVKEGGSGTMTGTSWNNAMAKMQDAIPMASYIDSLQIWVAAGTYYGDSIATNNAFTMADGVNVYGGFAGNEPANYDLSLRDFETNETVLDGQNVQRVLYQTADFTETTTWNGFKIQNGVTIESGGGAYVRAKSVLSHCNITNNTSRYGGGVDAYYSTLTNCNISNNQSKYNGGGVYASSSTLTNCNISNNQSRNEGGGVYAYSNSQFINCNIVNNQSSYYNGGGIYNSNSNNTYTNCIIWGNTINQIYGSSTFTYCAIQGGYTGTGNINLSSANDGTNSTQNYVRFILPENNLYQLQENSVCINKGNPNTGLSSEYDLAGNLRIVNDTIDIGVYEYKCIYNPHINETIAYGEQYSFYGKIISDPGYYTHTLSINGTCDSLIVLNLKVVKIMYVTSTGFGLQDGSSWENAMPNLQDAIDSLSGFTGNCIKQVWVAAGTYYGDSIATNNAFTMADGVNVYGGFAGNEPANYDLSLRDFETNETILDGQNVQRVLYQAADFTDTTTWDGFTIRNGNRNYYDANGYRDGGGAYLRAKSVLSHCNITNNTSSTNGGGVHASSSTLTNCNISNNTSSAAGGGVYANSNSQFINCNIVNNKSNYTGGGTYNSSSNNTYTNCIIWGNKVGSTANQIDGSSTFTYCAIEGGYTGEGNILLNSENNGNGLFYARFVNPSSIAGIDTITQNIDWRLQENSICINRGNDSLINTSFDLGGNTRIQQNRVDIGCYESPYQRVELPVYSDGIIYVKENGSGNKLGTSWNNAMDNLQDALTIASYMDSIQVWVAAGTYYGDSIAANNAFTMMEGVNVYGGFAGNEPVDYDLSLRDFETNVSILDGQRVQRVLYQANSFIDTTTWDGFTIRNGVGSGVVLTSMVSLKNCIIDNNTNKSGVGGISIGNSELVNCIISNNTGASVGGAHAYYSNLINCTFRNNTAIDNYNYWGCVGGVYAEHTVLANCNIQSNVAQITASYNSGMSCFGGGMCAISSSITNCKIVNNTNSNSGGGICIKESSMTNCIISNNKSNSHGGGVVADGSSLTNCLINNNYSKNIGGIDASYSLIFNCNIVSNQSEFSISGCSASGSDISNCIIWGNRSGGASHQIRGQNCLTTFCAIEGGFAGDSNINLSTNNTGTFGVYPSFIKPSLYVGIDTVTQNIDWSLQSGSICINRGNNAIADSIDITGNNRIQQGIVDIGCYESPYQRVELPTYSDKIIYVKEGGAGTMNGTSWSNAMSKIQDAIPMASSIDSLQIWVASGIYYGDSIAANNAFTMTDGIDVYGGFAGNEPADYDLALRDFETNETVLDGQHVQQVLYQPYNFIDTTTWNGFTIRNGVNHNGIGGAYLQANSILSECQINNNVGYYVGGIFADNSLITHCNIFNNQATNSDGSEGGGGVYAYSSMLQDCSIYDNESSFFAGGVFAENSTLKNCNIFNNASKYFGGVYAGESILLECIITYNKITGSGSYYGEYYGGAGIGAYSSSLTNCIISNNSSSCYGGGVFTEFSQFINCNIVNNKSNYTGGGTYNSSSNNTYTNCIIWGNKQGSTANQIYGSSTFTYCAIKGGYTGTGNINLSAENTGTGLHPYFVNPSAIAGVDTVTQNIDWHLLLGSACINAGDTNTANLPATDLAGGPRVRNDRVDIGAYEYVDCVANTELYDTICQGERYTLHGFNVFNSGIYQQTLYSALGCDSVVKLHLFTLPSYQITAAADICAGESYIWRGRTLSESGVYYDSLQTTTGCDSIVQLTLVVNQPIYTNLTATICQGEPYNQNGFDIPADSTMLAATRVETLYITSLQTGCDSTVTLKLTVNPTSSTSLMEVICQGEPYNENGFDIPADSTMVAGTRVETLYITSLQTGCDSIVTLTLTVNPSYNENVDITICASELPYHYINGEIDTTFQIGTPSLSTSYFLFSTSAGCDSIVQLTLIVNQPIYTNLTASICQGEPYNQNGFDIPADSTMVAGTRVETLYITSLQTGCDSTITLYLTINPSQLGNFTTMSPTDNYPLTSYPVVLSWKMVENARYYDLFVWNETELQPQSPTVSHLSSRRYSFADLTNRSTYHWYVKAYNDCDTVVSNTRSFTLYVTPTLTTNASNPVNFGEVALNASSSIYFQITGTALDSNITYQITGTDSAAFTATPQSGWNALSGGRMQLTYHPTLQQNGYQAQLIIRSDTLQEILSLKGYLSDFFVFNTIADNDVYPANQDVPIHGTLMNVLQEPVPNFAVEVYVTVMNQRITLPATTNQAGEFSVTYSPLNSEAGYYTIGSGRVGSNSTAVHDEFNIPGMMLTSSDYVLWTVTQGQNTTGTISVRNRSQVPLTNIQVTPVSMPSGCTITFTPLNLLGMEVGQLQYTVSGSTLSSGSNYEEVRLRAQSAEGAVMNFSTWYYCIPERGALVVTPTQITTNMTRGVNKIVDLQIYNNGTGATGEIVVSLPAVDWMSAVRTDTLPSLSVGDSAVVPIRLSPTAETALVPYTGNIAINCANGSGVSVPYNITCMSDSTGTLVVDVTDEYTYNTNNGNGPHLANATVTVKGYYSLQTVATGVTDQDGIFRVENLPEGYYRLSVRATQHEEYQVNIEIRAGETNTQDIFISFQAISYSWEVVPTEIEDQYTYELNVTYETNVPAPVVVIDMPETFPELATGETYTFNYVITNYGLIDAYGIELYTPTDHPLYDFSALITAVDTLPAQTSIVIPCVMSLLNSSPEPDYLSFSNDNILPDNSPETEETRCPYSALTKVKYCYYCAGIPHFVWSNLWRNIGNILCYIIPNVNLNIPWIGGSSGGGGGSAGGGAAVTPATTTGTNDCNSDPCSEEVKNEIDNCGNTSVPKTSKLPRLNSNN